MTELTPNQIQKLANRLLDTDGDLEEAIQDLLNDPNTYLEDIMDSSLNELDTLVVCCDSCGWWVQPLELQDGLCDRCDNDLDFEDDEDC